MIFLGISYWKTLIFRTKIIERIFIAWLWSTFIVTFTITFLMFKTFIMHDLVFIRWLLLLLIFWLLWASFLRHHRSLSFLNLIVIIYALFLWLSNWSFCCRNLPQILKLELILIGDRELAFFQMVVVLIFAIEYGEIIFFWEIQLLYFHLFLFKERLYSKESRLFGY